MLKKLSFENTQTILKYLALVVVLSTVSILYIAKSDHADPDSKAVGVNTGDVQSVVLVAEPTMQADQTPVIQSAALTIPSAQSDAMSLANSKLQFAFQTANEAIRQGDSEAAMRVLVELIAQYPELPEPYANLASLQAANGKLAAARATLLQGLQTDKTYAALFSNLQKIQGALAANAYTSALVDQGEAIATVALPVLENIGLLNVLNKEQQAQSPRLQAAAVELNATERELKINN